ncbi:MAG: SprB repeat-containing protein, partial [Bacteroidota bacterium]
MKKNIPTYSVFLKWVTLSTLWIIFNPQQSKASHAMGADITYQCLTNDTLLIRLTVYRDCSGSALNPQQPIYLGSNSCGIADTVLLADRVSVSEVPVICPAQQALSSCAGGILPGAEEHIYEVKVLLSQQCPDWRIGWALCCRNGAITNSVVDPSDTDMYIETLLDNTIGTCNNAPEFEEQLVPYLCVGEPFQFNAGATDPDGDSLAYELVDPLDYDYNTGVSFPVPYQPGFSFNSPMSTVGGFNFDPATGQISFTPSMIQVGIVAIRVREYRNGQLIATTMRDLQMIVLPCGNQAPIIQQPTNITGGQFNGNTFSVCVGNTLTFSIDGFDPDQDNITVSSTINATPSSVPGAVQNIANGGVFFTSNFTWTPALADTGIYFFSIRAIDDGCPRPQQSSVGYRIIVRRGEILPQRIINFCPSTQDSVAPITDIPAVPNATYLWTPFTGVSNPNSPNPIIEAPLAPTTYTLVQTSPGNCPRTQTFLIQPGADIVIPDDTVEICQGDTVALPVSVVFPGAPANFTLQWAPADPSILSSPTSSAPLAYPPTDTTYVVLASTTACQYTAEIRVLVEAPPQLNAIVDPLICYGDTTLLEATGLNLDNAQLQWLPTTTLSAPNSLSTEAYPLATTTYELKATNQCGVDSAGVTVTVASPLNLNASVEDLRCTGSNDGSIDIVPIGGLAPYVYNFSPAPPTPPINGLATNLLPGTYTVTAVDQAGCLDTLIIDINEPPPLLANLDDTEDVDCFGDNTGRIEVSASGGTPDYEYSIGGPFLNNGIFPNLTANTYTVTVRDQNNCTVNIPGVVIGQPATPITLTVDSLENTSCTDSVGRISVSISGGSGFYTLFLGQDSITSGVNVFTFTDLFPSTYLVIAEDSSGCTDFESVQIVELSDPFADLDSSQDPLCFGESTGSAMISVSDGVPPYNFSFQGSPFSPLTGNTFNPTNLPAGLYSFEVQDQNNCIYGIDFILEQPDTFLFQLGAYTPPLCTGGNEGQAIFLGFGGSPPYDYQLGSTLQDSGYFDNLSAGTYPFRLIDSRGCEVTTNIDLADPPALSGFATVENISCPGAADGVLNLSATGGSPNYEFSVQGSRFVQNTSFPNLLAGTYDIVVQDDNGCRDTLTANIIEPDPLGLLPGVIENVDCFGAASGQATLIGSGGTPPYQFALTGRPFSSSNVVDSLRRGQYVILMRDANGCESDTEVAIDEPFALRGDIESQPVLCFGDSNGIAEVFMQGGTAPYTYLWTNGETGARATSLPPGNPSVTITDDNG